MIHDFLPVCRQIWKKEAGTSAISSMFAETPMWTIRPSVPQSSACAGILRIQGRDHRPAGLEGQREHPGSRKTASRFLVSAGNMDSMVNHYSVSKRRRDKDSYTPGGVMGKRPDYAAVVYCNLIRSVYKDIPIVDRRESRRVYGAWPTMITGRTR